MSKKIFAAEISHTQAPESLRSKLVNDEMLALCAKRLQRDMDEVFVLSSSSRFVVYALGDSVDPLLNFFLQDHQLFRYVQFYKNTHASINHLFATASGLCSVIKGDNTIIAELENAYVNARRENTIGLVLDNLIRDAIRVGRNVRTQTGIDKFGLSVVDAGWDILFNRAEELFDKTILVIGSGEIARAMLDLLYLEGIQNIIIACEDASEASKMAMRYKACSIINDNVMHYFHQADVIIGCTNKEVALFSSTNSPSMHYLQSEGRKRHIILDFGIPKNFSERIRHFPLIELYDLDDIRGINESPLDAFGGIDSAWKLVTAEANDFYIVFQQLSGTPVLQQYWRSLASVKRVGNGPSLQSGEIHVQGNKLRNKYLNRTVKNTSSDSLKRMRDLTTNYQPDFKEESIQKLNEFKPFQFNVSLN
jgi:glutamyl-tRNA reductase